MSVYEQQITRALNWLLHSGIQTLEGGVSRYYRSGEQRYQPVSTEITGYHAGTLVWLYQATRRPEALHAAVATAEFLVHHAWNAELATFPFEYPHPSPAYFFDCGIIVRGLLAVWRVTQTPVYRQIAESCAAGMLRDFDAGFDFYPVLKLPEKKPALRDPRWSQSSGCYQLKAALAWHDLGLREPWERLRAQSLDRHDEFLPGHSDEDRVMDRLHAYCYFLEALLAATAQPECGRAVAIGVQRVAFLLHTIAPVFVRSDVYAQLLRIRLYAAEAKILPLDSHTAALEAERLAAFQLTSTDPRIDGGFCFGRRGGELLPFVNPVSTDFALQALYLWHLHQTGSALPPAAWLV